MTGGGGRNGKVGKQVVPSQETSRSQNSMKGEKICLGELL